MLNQLVDQNKEVTFMYSFILRYYQLYFCQSTKINHTVTSINTLSFFQRVPLPCCVLYFKISAFMTAHYSSVSQNQPLAKC